MAKTSETRSCGECGQPTLINTRINVTSGKRTYACESCHKEATSYDVSSILMYAAIGLVVVPAIFVGVQKIDPLNAEAGFYVAIGVPTALAIYRLVMRVMFHKQNPAIA